MIFFVLIIKLLLNILFVQGEDYTVIPVRPRLTLVKKDADAKTINDSLMSRLRPIYRGSASALAALTGMENGSAKKEEGTQLFTINFPSIVCGDRFLPFHRVKQKSQSCEK